MDNKRVDDAKSDLGGPFFCLLPDELVLRILSFLSLPEVALKVMQVGNHRIKTVCQDPTLWAHIRVSQEEWGQTRTVRKILLMAGAKLNELTLSTAQVTHGDDCTTREIHVEYRMLAILALQKSPNLQRLNCGPGVISADVMRAIGEKSNALRKVFLMPVKHLDTHLYIPATDLFANICYLKNLTHIDFEWLLVDDDMPPLRHRNNRMNSADWVRTLVDSCQHLEVVGLPCSITSTLSDQIFNYFLEGTWCTLKELCVFGSLLTEASIRNLKYCQSLKNLCLQYESGIGRKGVDVIAELSTKLQRLCMLSWDAGCEQQLAAAFAGKIMNNLTHLGLVGYQFNDATITLIATSCPNLNKLELVNECLGVGDTEIGIILHICKKLTHLILYQTQVTAKGFARAYIRSVSKIRKLGVSDQAFVDEIAKILPQLDCTLELIHVGDGSKKSWHGP